MPFKTESLNSLKRENFIDTNIVNKNIKRNLTNSKTIIYESELSKERFEYYITLIIISIILNLNILIASRYCST